MMRSRTAEWFETKIKYEKTMEDGLTKKVTEQYVVDALSFTEAERRIVYHHRRKDREGETLECLLPRAGWHIALCREEHRRGHERFNRGLRNCQHRGDTDHGCLRV